MKFGLSALVAFAVGIPFGGCTGVFVAAFLGGGLWTVALVTVAFVVSGYKMSNARFDREQEESIRKQMEAELLAAQWEELRTRARP